MIRGILVFMNKAKSGNLELGLIHKEPLFLDSPSLPTLQLSSGCEFRAGVR